MSGLGTIEWDPDNLDKFERNLELAGYYIEHCAHCDRSNRHPSCIIRKLPDGDPERPGAGLQHQRGGSDSHRRLPGAVDPAGTSTS